MDSENLDIGENIKGRTLSIYSYGPQIAMNVNEVRGSVYANSLRASFANPKRKLK